MHGELQCFTEAAFRAERCKRSQPERQLLRCSRHRLGGTRTQSGRHRCMRRSVVMALTQWTSSLSRTPSAGIAAAAASTCRPSLPLRSVAHSGVFSLCPPSGLSGPRMATRGVVGGRYMSVAARASACLPCRLLRDAFVVDVTCRRTRPQHSVPRARSLTSSLVHCVPHLYIMSQQVCTQSWLCCSQIET